MAKFFKVVLFSLAIFAFAYGDEDAKTEEESENTAADEKISVEVIDVPADCERKTKKFDQLSMQYTGVLTETKVKFDSSYDRNEPFKFQIGTGQVIKGWDEGLLDMCVGEKRKLVIPASKGYGAAGAGELIPPNSGLTFDVELVGIEDGEIPPNVFKEIDTNNDKMLSQEEVSAYLKEKASEFGDENQTEEQHNEVITQIFQHEDQNKDGMISHEEFSGPKHDEL